MTKEESRFILDADEAKIAPDDGWIEIGPYLRSQLAGAIKHTPSTLQLLATFLEGADQIIEDGGEIAFEITAARARIRRKSEENK